VRGDDGLFFVSGSLEPFLFLDGHLSVKGNISCLIRLLDSSLPGTLILTHVGLFTTIIAPNDML
jgi:hypothetical protein